MPFSQSCLEPQSAINGKNLPSDEAGVRSKKQNSLCDILRSAVSPHGSSLRKTRRGRLSVAFTKINPAWGYAVHRDVRSKGLGHGLREHVERGLRRAVMGVAGPCAQTAE